MVYGIEAEYSVPTASQPRRKVCYAQGYSEAETFEAQTFRPCAKLHRKPARVAYSGLVIELMNLATTK